MATLPIASQVRSHGRILVTWTGITNDDDGSPFEPPVGYDLDSMQTIGTIGTTPVLALQGSNDGTNWGLLDTQVQLGFLIPSAQAVTFRPAIVGGTGSTVTFIASFMQEN